MWRDALYTCPWPLSHSIWEYLAPFPPQLLLCLGSFSSFCQRCFDLLSLLHHRYASSSHSGKSLPDAWIGKSFSEFKFFSPCSFRQFWSNENFLFIKQLILYHGFTAHSYSNQYFEEISLPHLIRDWIIVLYQESGPNVHFLSHHFGDKEKNYFVKDLCQISRIHFHRASEQSLSLTSESQVAHSFMRFIIPDSACDHQHLRFCQFEKVIAWVEESMSTPGEGLRQSLFFR